MLAIIGYKQFLGNEQVKRESIYSLYKPASSDNLTTIAMTVKKSSSSLPKSLKISSSPLAII